MKNERNDLNRLLGGLLLFCVISALLYVHNEPGSTINQNAEIEANQPVAEFSSKQLVANMTALIEARDINAIAELLVGLSVAQAREVLTIIISDDSFGLTAQEKLSLILATVRNYLLDPAAHTLLLNSIAEHGNLFKDFSLIYFAAAHGYSAMIPILEQWAQEQSKNSNILPELFARAVYKGLHSAIAHNNVEAFKNIIAQQVVVSPEQASDLLWFAVTQAKDPAFVQLLVDHGANINVTKNGYSLLMQAVETKQLDLVKAVAQANPKPNINALYDPKVGTALQLAIQQSLTEIDDYLRSQGARE